MLSGVHVFLLVVIVVVVIARALNSSGGHSGWPVDDRSLILVR